MSLTHMATRSMPTVPSRPAIAATFTLVPTPSVPETRTGSRYFRAGKRKKPAKEPISPRTSLRCVVRTIGRIRRTRRSPSSISTPAVLYVTGFFKIRSGWNVSHGNDSFEGMSMIFAPSRGKIIGFERGGSHGDESGDRDPRRRGAEGGDPGGEPRLHDPAAGRVGGGDGAVRDPSGQHPCGGAAPAPVPRGGRSPRPDGGDRPDAGRHHPGRRRRGRGGSADRPPRGEGGAGSPAVQGIEPGIPSPDGPGPARRDADPEPALPGPRFLHRPDGDLPRRPAHAPGDVRLAEADGLRPPQEPRRPLYDGPGVVIRRDHEGGDDGLPRGRHRVVPDERGGVPRTGGVPRRPLRADGRVRRVFHDAPLGDRVRSSPTGGGAWRRCVRSPCSSSRSPRCSRRPDGSSPRGRVLGRGRNPPRAGGRRSRSATSGRPTTGSLSR